MPNVMYSGVPGNGAIKVGVLWHYIEVYLHNHLLRIFTLKVWATEWTFILYIMGYGGLASGPYV